MDKNETQKVAIDYAGKTLTAGTPPQPKLDNNGPPDYSIYGLPDALNKACCDEFEYALGLRDGTILFFDYCRYVPGSQWIHLRGLTYDSAGAEARSKYHSKHVGGDIKSKLLPIPFERGMDIRLADITWVADGPWGS